MCVCVCHPYLVVPLGLGEPLLQLFDLLRELFDSLPRVSQQLGQVHLEKSQQNTQVTQQWEDHFTTHIATDVKTILVQLKPNR